MKTKYLTEAERLVSIKLDRATELLEDFKNMSIIDGSLLILQEQTIEFLNSLKD